MVEPAQPEVTHTGYIAIVGRPNVGKSTLLNHLLGQKISITSRKPQTTRHQVLGILTEGNSQLLFVDTPGLHKAAGKPLNRLMNRAASSALRDVDAVLMVLDRTAWTDEDVMVLEQVQRSGAPVIVVINKVDLLADKRDLLPHLQWLAEQGEFHALMPLSALNRDDVQQLRDTLLPLMPAGPQLFPDDQVTDRSQRFMTAEIVREKVMRQLGDELPYAVTVEVEEFREGGPTLHIGALILVEREGQKKILIGRGGSRLRAIGTAAREDMERLFETKVMLKLWVKVKSGWSSDERALRSLGYDDGRGS